jgi:FAD/FMN-containing dehydrogenase
VKQLFIGSEGTLGIVTRVVLRLFPQPASRQTALVAVPGFDEVVSLLGTLQQQLAGSLSAFELMWGNYFEAVTDVGGHRSPLARHYPFYVVAQAEGSEPTADAHRFEEVLGSALENGFIVDAVIAKSDAESAVIWEIRENFEVVLESQSVYLYDVSLPIREMAGYVETVKRSVAERWPDGRCYVFGHMADGNLHLFVNPHEGGDLQAVSDEIVYAPLPEIGGSVSAEHGIGRDRLRWLPHSRNPAEIALMSTMKRSLDPKNLLNPGKVLEAGS